MKKKKPRRKPRKQVVEVVVTVVHEYPPEKPSQESLDNWDRPLVWDPFWNEYVRK